MGIEKFVTQLAGPKTCVSLFWVQSWSPCVMVVACERILSYHISLPGVLIAEEGASAEAEQLSG